MPVDRCGRCTFMARKKRAHLQAVGSGAASPRKGARALTALVSVGAIAALLVAASLNRPSGGRAPPAPAPASPEGLPAPGPPAEPDLARLPVPSGDLDFTGTSLSGQVWSLSGYRGRQPVLLMFSEA